MNSEEKLQSELEELRKELDRYSDYIKCLKADLTKWENGIIHNSLIKQNRNLESELAAAKKENTTNDAYTQLLKQELASVKSELEEAKAGERSLLADLNTLKDLVSGKDGETLLILNELIDYKQVYELSVEENNKLQSDNKRLRDVVEGFKLELQNWDDAIYDLRTFHKLIASLERSGK